ncbi:hypothetical protein DL96DRAFT_1619275 [Flagelloscypha sp. PMI_526]|nr:hypothetical protein DL96DRAFT_1619275 [Flagelloscypha sp. PMI_526]
MLSRFVVRAPRIAPRTVATVRWTSSTKEGSTAQSREFGSREKAQEDMYVRERQKQVLAKLREEIEKKKNELAALEKAHSETETETKK